MSIESLRDLVRGGQSAFGVGGSSTPEPWVYVKLASDFVTNGTANADTLLAFHPDPNTTYEIEGRFFLQAAATTTGARPGIKWPTAGVLQNAAWMMSPNSATAFSSRFWGNTAGANAASTGVAVANEGIYGQLQALLVTGGSVTGDFIVTLASEVAASDARIMANSFIRYRKAEAVVFGGGTEGPTGPMGPKSISLPDPTASEKVVLFHATEALTLSKLSAVLPGGSATPSVTYGIAFGPDVSAAGTAVVTAGVTVTSTTTGAQTTTFDNAVIPAGSYVWLITTAKSGTVPMLHVTLEF
jgi:hypothetical protein